MSHSPPPARTLKDIARLAGVRFVASVETEEGQRLAESMVKQITGGDKVTARFLFREFFEFDPAFKLFLAANHRPTIQGTDHAIWRRINLIPFEVVFDETTCDSELAGKLRLELDGILRWAVEGCTDWQANGLKAPGKVRVATAEYRATQDVLGGFIAERCVMATTNRVSSKELWEAYVQWSGDTVSQKRFNDHVRDRGYVFGDRSTGGRRFWEGIGLIHDGHELE